MKIYNSMLKEIAGVATFKYRGHKVSLSTISQPSEARIVRDGESREIAYGTVEQAIKAIDDGELARSMVKEIKTLYGAIRER